MWCQVQRGYPTRPRMHGIGKCWDHAVGWIALSSSTQTANAASPGSNAKIELSGFARTALCLQSAGRMRLGHRKNTEFGAAWAKASAGKSLQPQDAYTSASHIDLGAHPSRAPRSISPLEECFLSGFLAVELYPLPISFRVVATELRLGCFFTHMEATQKITTT